jgi:hypothetical protein
MSGRKNRKLRRARLMRKKIMLIRLGRKRLISDLGLVRPSRIRSPLVIFRIWSTFPKINLRKNKKMPQFHHEKRRKSIGKSSTSIKIKLISNSSQQPDCKSITAF